MGFDLEKSIEGLAPTLATMLLGPMAGKAVTVLEECFGLDAGAGKDAISNAISTGGMTPEIAATIRQKDQEHEVELKRLEIDLVKINADHQAAMVQADITDRASARDREIKTGDSWTVRIVALAVFLSWGWVNYQVFDGSFKFDPNQGVLIGKVLTTIDAAVMCILYYLFGGSAGQARQTELLSQAPAIQK